MSTGVTPAFGLLLGEDSLENENWQKLDRAMKALSREIIPDNVVIQGNLEVTGDALIDGALDVTGAASFDSTLTAVGLVRAMHGLQVDAGPVTLPAGTVAGAALVPGSGVFTAQTGTAQTAQQPLTATPRDLCEIILSPADDPARWQLVLLSMQVQIGLNSDPGAAVSQAVILRLKRGQTVTSVVQTRTLNYTLTRAGFMDVPIAATRLTKPVNTSDGISRWAIEGLTGTANAMSITCDFAQLSVVSFL